MEAEIQTTTPQGSAILAYGEVKKPSFGGPKLWFSLLGIMLFIGIVLLASFILHVSLPKDVVLIASFHGNSDLPDPLPHVWHNTASTSKLPFIAGISRQGDSVQPFTITLRGFGNAGSWTQGVGPFMIHADAPLQVTSTSLGSVLQPLFALGKHSAWLRIYDGSGDLATAGSLSGPIDGNVWMTDTAITKHATHRLGNGDVVADLEALPESWGPIRDALADSGISLEQMPSTIAWTQTTDTLPQLDLSYDNGPSSSTILALAAAAGQFDSSPYTLPDGTLADDLSLPEQILTSTSTLHWQVTSSTSVWIDGQEAHISSGATSVESDALCPGDPIASFSQNALNQAMSTFDLPLDSIHGLRAVDQQGKLTICWK